ncbi:MAG TPA: hypothetical protein VJG90_04820 [Candidatus Nanoarchaeia archaeon]|nr:hypothetical protein [Candidatus Nanoarchaeia archaeon]
MDDIIDLERTVEKDGRVVWEYRNPYRNTYEPVSNSSASDQTRVESKDESEERVKSKKNLADSLYDLLFKNKKKGKKKEGSPPEQSYKKKADKEEPLETEASSAASSERPKALLGAYASQGKEGSLDEKLNGGSEERKETGRAYNWTQKGCIYYVIWFLMQDPLGGYIWLI